MALTIHSISFQDDGGHHSNDDHGDDNNAGDARRDGRADVRFQERLTGAGPHVHGGRRIPHQPNAQHDESGAGPVGGGTTGPADVDGGSHRRSRVRSVCPCCIRLWLPHD